MAAQKQADKTASKAYFLGLESLTLGESRALEDVLSQLAFNEQGLIPAIAQDVDTGEVLMLAWMNREALERTLQTGTMTYWSRSRSQFWIKGETSGNVQAVVDVRIDCDGDAVLCRVRQTGGACHTGRRNCFYLLADAEAGKVRLIESNSTES